MIRLPALVLALSLILGETAAAAPAAAGPQRIAVVPGKSGAQIRYLQQRLRDLRFRLGPVTGVYDTAMIPQVWALQKTYRIRPDQRVNAATWAALRRARPRRPLIRNGPANRVEIDLRRQLLAVYRRGRLKVVIHVSTGSRRYYCAGTRCGTAVTPVGDFRIYRRDRGWRLSRLGWMFQPAYFNRGVAIHGSLRVPRRPASHGCVRVSMPDSLLISRIVPVGTKVYVRDRHPSHRTKQQAPAKASRSRHSPPR